MSFSRPEAYSGIDLEVRAGEVVGLTGLEGSGPGELVRGLFGFEELGSGEVKVDGKKFDAGSPVKALAQGVAYLPRDRHGLGIAGIRTVKDNISLSVFDKLKNALGLVDGTGERALVDDYVRSLGIITPSIDKEISNLSGGNQQKCIVAKFAATEPRALVVDEPMQGVDIAAKVEILRIVDDLSKRGVAICVVTDKVSELIDICNRIVVFYRGNVSREFVKSKEMITPKGLVAAIEGVTNEEVHEPV